LKNKDRIYIIIVSILLHLLLFFIYEAGNFLNLFDTSQVKIVVSEPIVFDLQTENMPRRVIETEKNTENKKPENAKLLSDKNSVAKNSIKKKDLRVDESYSKGEYKSYEIPKPSGVPVKPVKKTNPKKTEKQKVKKDLKDYIQKKTAEEMLKEEVKKRNTPPIKSGISKRRNLLLHNNIISKSLDMGGLSFNTYNWEFAPYMLMLKSIIQNNIFPPLAFTKLGLINGVTVVRFRIYPNGELKALEVLGYKGHKSLMETSYDAVRISAPFPKLPDNFPEKYLEVTGKFVYILRGKNK